MTTTPISGSAPNATPPDPKGIATGADFNMFLKLLTTQMQHQDPLDPMDTSEYTQQLVQYSQVEQSMQQTGVLRDILGRLSTQDMAQTANFIGRDVEFNSATAGLGAAPALWSYELPRNATSVVGTVKDSSGRVVATQTLDAADRSGRFTWDGTLANGAKAPAGAYTLSLAAQDSAGASIDPKIRSIGRVQDVTAASGVVSLGVNGIQLPASTIVRIAAAAS
jgi:flagellar basal-body rod modification protein FlgD